MKYFDKYKKDMFPDITDWSGEQEQYRYMPKNLAAKKLPMKYWVFFTPSAYHLITFSYQIVSILTFGGIFLYSGIRMFKNGYFLFLFLMSAIITFTVSKKLIDSIKYYKTMKNFTFYDMFMRE